MPPEPQPAPALAGADIEARITAVGEALSTALEPILAELPGATQQLARTLSVDKVLTSRLLKALRGRDPMAVVHHLPGPEPMRRFLKAARRRGLPAETVSKAERAVERFERLIRDDAGDRSTLNAMISAWLPEARREFELRRKQSAYKAMSELKGVTAHTHLGTAIYHPSDDGQHLDVLWIFGLLGLQRLRAGATVKLATRRIMDRNGEPRHPTTLEGQAVDDIEGLRLDAFCDAPPAPVEVRAVGESVHYVLGGDDFGPSSGVDLLLAELNRRELPRTLPAGSGRRSYTFAEVPTPARSLLFDVLLHDDVYPGSDPELVIYDTVLEGVADVNDPTRDVDRLDLAESIQGLGRGLQSLRATGVPHYDAMIKHVLGRVGWDASSFRAYRCRIDYPLYGSQVVMMFDPPTH